MATDKLHIDTLLQALNKQKGSDLHLKAGAPPIMRKKLKLSVLDPQFPVMDYSKIDQLMLPLLSDNLQEELRTEGAVDIGYGLKDIGRFRFNIFFQRGTLRVVIRRIPHYIPTFKELNLPEEMLAITSREERGLILMSGATGMGKSTSLASMINYINKTKNKHILTIEDPIEFLIQDHHSLVTQRELGVDCHDPVVALKSALRQDPDIILFSELRSKDIISIALNAAETGHLVFSTIHTSESAEVIPRILSSFSPSEQMGVRLTLSSVLKAVFSQRLVPKKDKTGQIPAVEILVNNPRIKHEIERNAPVEKIREIVAHGKTPWGMQTFDQHLISLLQANQISEKDAIRYSTSPEKIKMALAGISIAG